MCEKCLQQNRENQKSRRLRRAENGICTTCGTRTPREGLKTCTVCGEKAAARHLADKIKCMEKYGGLKCACCGESRSHMFLCIDHIDNDGAEHRRTIGHDQMYMWLKANGYPDGYQVLCHNCNIGRHLNGGTCPHKQR